MQVLEEKGYTAGKQETEGNNPTRTVYSLTETGKDYYKKLLLSFLEESVDKHHQFWFALSLIDNEVSKDDFLKLVDKKLAFVEHIIKKHKEEECGPVGFSDIENPPFVFNHMIRLGDKITEFEKEALLLLRKDVIDNYDNHRGKK